MPQATLLRKRRELASAPGLCGGFGADAVYARFPQRPGGGQTTPRPHLVPPVAPGETGVRLFSLESPTAALPEETRRAGRPDSGYRTPHTLRQAQRAGSPRPLLRAPWPISRFGDAHRASFQFARRSSCITILAMRRNVPQLFRGGCAPCENGHDTCAEPLQPDLQAPGTRRQERLHRPKLIPGFVDPALHPRAASARRSIAPAPQTPIART